MDQNTNDLRNRVFLTFFPALKCIRKKSSAGFVLCLLVATLKTCSASTKIIVIEIGSVFNCCVKALLAQCVFRLAETAKVEVSMKIDGSLWK